MISCQKCSASNISSRRFCRECGTPMVSSCRQCGFGNMPDDKFCGGCGINLRDTILPDRQPQKMPLSASVSGKYSYDDISELIQGQTQKTEAPRIKRDLKTSEAVSQDMLDSIFDSTDSD